MEKKMKSINPWYREPFVWLLIAFPLTAVVAGFITLGLAWLTELAGLSLALGAFIAGMLISETEYKHQVETDIRPFHDVLLGLFFISIGMIISQISAATGRLTLAISALPITWNAAGKA
mgnify:CR=1 FL=1